MSEKDGQPASSVDVPSHISQQEVLQNEMRLRASWEAEEVQWRNELVLATLQTLKEMLISTPERFLEKIDAAIETRCAQAKYHLSRTEQQALRNALQNSVKVIDRGRRALTKEQINALRPPGGNFVADCAVSPDELRTLCDMALRCVEHEKPTIYP